MTRWRNILDAMKELKVANTLICFVDDEDYERLGKYVWSFNGTVKRNVYKTRRNMFSISMANDVMQDYAKMFDHKDRNPFNNQKNNLRPATQSQNIMNTPKRKGTSSQYKGVCWVKAKQKWRAHITLNGKQINLGYFSDEISAAIAYDKKAVELFKEFANLNIK